MNTMMKHRGYEGTVEADFDGGLLHGRVQGVADVIHYEAVSLPELEKAFRDGVEDFLAFCAADGVDPEKPFSGKLLVRLGPELHRAASAAAAREEVSLNRWVCAAVKAALQPAGKGLALREG